MKEILKATVLSLMLFTSLFTYGQGQSMDRGKGIGLAPDFIAEKVADFVVTTRGSKWLVLRQDAHIPPRQIFDQHRDAFYLGKDDQMDIVREDEDDLGFTHYRYHSL